MNYISYAVICGAEALISWLYFNYLFEQKYSKFFALVTVICGYSLCFFAYQLNVTAVNLFSFFLVNFFIAKSNYNCRIKTAVLHSAFLSFIMGISEIAVAATMDVFNQNFMIYVSNAHIMFIMTILSKSLYLLLAALGAKLFKPHKRYGDEPRPMLAFCLIPVFSMVVSLMVAYVGLNIELTKAAELMIIVTFISLLFVNLILFVIYNYVIKTNYNYTRLELINQKDRTNAEYYKSLYENTENQRLSLDLSRVISAIAYLNQNYIKSLSALKIRLTEDLCFLPEMI